MAYYRLCCRRNGQYLCFDEFQAVDDIQAASLARAFVGGNSGDLWCGKRRVTLFDAVMKDAA